MTAFFICAKAMQVLKIEKTPTFDIAQTLDCGQVFRFHKEGDSFVVYALDHMAKITQNEREVVIESDDSEFFYNYFDFEQNYALIQSKCDDKGFVLEAIEYGKGIRLLRQNPVETIFSFIVSQNNHIPRIKGIIERMCEALGEKKDGYFAFPTIDSLAGAGEEFFKSIGAGYRAAYLDKVAKALQGEDVEGWSALDTEILRQKLMSLHGIGRKVADCILLFGFQRYDVFPVDTWIKKVFEETYPNIPADKMSTLLVQKYQKYAGFVQQWLFYYKREKKV